MKNIDSINTPPRSDIPTPTISINTHPTNKSKSVSLITRPKSRGRTIVKWFIGVIILIVIVLGVFLVSRAMNLTSKIFVGQKTTFLGKIANIFKGQTGNVTLTGEDLGQINVLLLGIGGEGHDGPYLTDTIIVAQIRPDIGQVVLTSIPRDYLVSLPKGNGDQKINAAFALGFNRNKDWNEAGTWARETVEKVTGLTIPYFAVIDFTGFEKAVDQIGGLDIQIDRTFTDYTYPDNKLGYLPAQTFTEGFEHMNGARSLIFARSRHAAGPEGSDFSRSLRQQKVIQAFKQKVLSLNLITDASTLNNLLGIFADHFHTNLQPSEILHIYGLAKDKNIQTFLPLSLDPEGGLICNSIQEVTNAYILSPCPGVSTTDIKNFFLNAFSIGKLAAEKSTVWLANSTTNRQAYRTAFRKLTNAGIMVMELPYTIENLPKTIVYQASPKPATTEYIKNVLGAQEANLPPPDVKLTPGKVDVVVILGTNALVEPDPVYTPPPAPKPTTTPTSSPSTLSTGSGSTTAPTSSTSTPPKASNTPTSKATTTPTSKATTTSGTIKK